MADSILAESPGHLTGVARVLVNAGKLETNEADTLARTAKEQKSSFVHALVSSGKLKPADLAPTLSKALSVPVMDRAAVDVQRLPNVNENLQRSLAAARTVLNFIDTPTEPQERHAAFAPRNLPSAL